MPKKLLVLGASRYQMPVILKARSMGLIVLVADNMPSNPGHAEADISFDCDTTDAEGIAALATGEGVSGIIAPATDIALPALALACSRLELPGPGVEAARILTSKTAFRTLQAELRLPSPAFAAFCEPVWPEALDRKGGPWAMKPNMSSGSKGVFKVNGPGEFESLARETLGHSLDRTGILEGWVEGSQHTCEGVAGNGLSSVMITDRETAPPPWAATWGHFSPPSSFSPRSRESLAYSIDTVFSRLDIKDVPFDCDFVVSGPDGPVFILEITPRLGGNSLSSLFAVSMEADIQRYAICHALGLRQDFVPRTNPLNAAVLLFGVVNRGKLRWNRDAAESLAREPWVAGFEMDLPYGAQVEPFANGRCRVGEALIRGDSPATTRERASNFRARLDVRAV